MNKKFLYPLAAIVVASVISVGCGTKTADSKESPATTAPTTTEAPRRQTTTTTVPSQSVMIEAYVLAMNDYFPTMSRSDAITLGKTMCDTIDVYGNVADTVTGIIESGRFRGMEGDVGYLMGVSIPVFCPEYEAEARRLFR